MSDFDFEFDFDLDFETKEDLYVEQPLWAMVRQANAKHRHMSHIDNETRQLSALIQEFDKTKVYKFLSVKGGFASINFIDYVAGLEVIQELTVCTLAVGKAQIERLENLKQRKRLKNANFIVSTIFKQRGELVDKYGYYDAFQEICDRNKWRYKLTNNHAKIILMRTAQNFYVLETSSNLNENPKIEQFSFETSKELYEFYYRFCDELLNS